MNGKQRLKDAMDMKPVFPVPFMCQMSIGHMLVQLDVSPLEFWFDKNVYKDGLIKLRELYGFDGILISLHGHNPNWREDICNIVKTDDFLIGEFKNGDKIFCPYDELPYYEFKNPEIKYLLNDISASKLTEHLNFIPVSQNLPFFIDSNHTFDIFEEMVESFGKEFSIHGEITSPFDYYLDYFGHQDGLMGLLVYPEKVHIVLKHYTDLLIKLASEMSETGIDAIKLSSPFAGAGFISPQDYKEFVFPYEKKIVQTIRKKNIHVYIHTCGAISDRLELLMETGASGIECLDPKPLGDVDLSDAKKRIGSKGFIKGNLDSVNLLLNGDKEEIISDVKKRIEIGSRNGGFILSTACSIAPNTKKENIQIIKKVADEWQ